MMDTMELFPSLLGTLVSLVMKPFTFGTLVVIFSLKTMFVVVQTWLELMKITINVPLSVIRKTMVWIVAVITIPMWVLSALQRERLLEEQLHQMQIELENIICYEEQLEVQLKTAINRRRLVESLLAEVEDETDKAIAKVEQLEVELQVLKEENHKLKEILNKGGWSIWGRDNAESGKNDDDVSSMVQYWEARNQGSRISCWKGDSNSKSGEFDSKRKEPNMHPFSPANFSRNLERNEDLDRRREIALSQSLFSALLSLLIRMIIWKAEDPCMPLVLALFTIVGMSLRSVVQFFSTINNKPASDAVALLSLNCFILGTLSFPALPSMVR